MVIRKAIRNSNNTIEEEITKLIITAIKFQLNDKGNGAQIIPFFGVNKIIITDEIVNQKDYSEF